MADYILGAVLMAALFFALCHIYRNLVAGRSDCLGGGCPGCGGKCADCHTKP